jgi:hypothetical protein
LCRPAPVTGGDAGISRGSRAGQQGLRYPADPPKVEEIVAVMRAAGDGAQRARLCLLAQTPAMSTSATNSVPRATPSRSRRICAEARVYRWSRHVSREVTPALSAAAISGG